MSLNGGAFGSEFGGTAATGTTIVADYTRENGRSHLSSLNFRATLNDQ